MKKHLFLVLSILALTGCGSGGLLSDYHNATYAIQGTTTRANVTLTYADGSISQNTLPVPYETGKLTFKEGDFLYLAAQNDLATGTITAVIKVDGKVWKTVTSSGAYSIATASGSCC